MDAIASQVEVVVIDALACVVIGLLEAAEGVVGVVDGGIGVGGVDDGQLFEAEDVAGGAEMLVRAHLDAELAECLACWRRDCWDVEDALTGLGGVGVEAAPVAAIDVEIELSVIGAGADGEEALVAGVGDLHAATELCRLLEVASIGPSASGKGDGGVCFSQCIGDGGGLGDSFIGTGAVAASIDGVVELAP